MTPEQKARVSIDALLKQAGWHVCSMADANIHASRGVAWRYVNSLSTPVTALPTTCSASTAKPLA
jgi:hypothetical protein